MMLWRSLIFVFLLLGAASSLSEAEENPHHSKTNASTQVASKPPIAQGQTAPPLCFEKLLQAPQNQTTDWKTLQGKVVVIEFWATWCGPCIAAMPHMNELAMTFADKPVVFISVTDESESKISPFLKKRPIRGWIGLDTDRSVIDAFGITHIPQTIIVKPDGKIAGVTSPGDLKKEMIESLLQGKETDIPNSMLKAFSLKAGSEIGTEQDRQPAVLKIVIRPAATPAQMTSSSRHRLSMSSANLRDIIAEIYDTPGSRVKLEGLDAETRYDLTAIVPTQRPELLHAILRETVTAVFEIEIKHEERTADALELRVKESGELKLMETASAGGSSRSTSRRSLGLVNTDMAGLAEQLEDFLGLPVVDETGLTKHYDISLTWSESTQDAILETVKTDLGLDVKHVRRSVEFLIVRGKPRPK